MNSVSDALITAMLSLRCQFTDEFLVALGKDTGWVILIPWMTLGGATYAWALPPHTG
jgi:hypothetical protein